MKTHDLLLGFYLNITVLLDHWSTNPLNRACYVYRHRGVALIYSWWVLSCDLSPVWHRPMYFLTYMFLETKKKHVFSTTNPSLSQKPVCNYTLYSIYTVCKRKQCIVSWFIIIFAVWGCAKWTHNGCSNHYGESKMCKKKKIDVEFWNNQDVTLQ